MVTELPPALLAEILAADSAGRVTLKVTAAPILMAWHPLCAPEHTESKGGRAGLAPAGSYSNLCEHHCQKHHGQSQHLPFQRAGPALCSTELGFIAFCTIYLD